jgi:hypothetical protein
MDVFGSAGAAEAMPHCGDLKCVRSLSYARYSVGDRLTHCGLDLDLTPSIVGDASILECKSTVSEFNALQMLESLGASDLPELRSSKYALLAAL